MSKRKKMRRIPAAFNLREEDLQPRFPCQLFDQPGRNCLFKGRTVGFIYRISEKTGKMNLKMHKMN